MSYNCIPLNGEGTLLSGDKDYYSIAQYRFSSAKSVEDVRSKLDPIATSQDMIVGYHICIDKTTGRYLEGALIFDAKLIQAAPKSVFPPTVSELFGDDGDITLAWTSPHPQTEGGDGMWLGTGSPLTNLASFAVNKGWKGWKAYYCPPPLAPISEFNFPVEADFDSFIKHLESVNRGFQKLYNSPVAMESFFPGGKERFLIAMQSAMKMNAMDPEEVKQKLKNEAKADQEELNKQADKLLAEKIAAGAATAVAACLSWIPFVGVAVGFADIGLEIGLYIDEQNIEKGIDELLKNEKDTTTWLHNHPDIQNGHALMVFLVQGLGGKTSGNPDDVAAAAICSHLIYYLQTHLLIGGDIPTIDEIDKDLKKLGNEEGERPGEDYKNFQATFKTAMEEIDDLDKSLLVDKEIWKNLMYASWTLRGAKPLLIFMKNKILDMINPWSGFENMQFAITEMDVLEDLGIVERGAAAVEEASEAATIMERATTEAKWYTQARAATWNSTTKFEKAVVALGLIASIVEVSLAIVQFDDLKKQFKTIYDLRVQYADTVRNYWKKNKNHQ